MSWHSEVSTLQPWSPVPLAWLGEPWGKALCRDWHQAGQVEVAARIQPAGQQRFGHALHSPSPEGSSATDGLSAPSKGHWQVPVHCSPSFVFLRLICTSLLFIWVLQALCTSKPLAYTRNLHKFLPGCCLEDAASRQSPVAKLPALPGRAAAPSQLGRVCGYQPEPYASHGKEGSPSAPHGPAQVLAAEIGCCWDGILPVPLIPVGRCWGPCWEASLERADTSRSVSLLWARHLK